MLDRCLGACLRGVRSLLPSLFGRMFFIRYFCRDARSCIMSLVAVAKVPDERISMHTAHEAAVQYCFNWLMRFGSERNRFLHHSMYSTTLLSCPISIRIQAHLMLSRPSKR